MEVDTVLACRGDAAYFIDKFCWIEDKVQGEWVRFRLWERQRAVASTLATSRQVIVLKARQLGLTWLTVCYGLWMMLFRPGSGILLFSRRADEAAELLERMRGVHVRLPASLQAEVTEDRAQALVMGKIGSWARCFPTTKHSGRAYSATMAIVDEADFIPELKMLLNAVKPTVDAGGKLVLISTANKELQDSAYKRIWQGAVKGMNGYAAVFLPWDARPDRDAGWYARQMADYEEDDLHQEYPANPEQALSARKSRVRFRPEWLTRCRGDGAALEDVLGVPGCTIYAHPEVGRRYLVSADPAEGNPDSDPSAAVVLDAQTWAQVAVIHGSFEPDIFAGYLAQVAVHYNGATILVERNNHGHAVLLALAYMDYGNLYVSPMDEKPGWLSTRRDKVLAVDHAAQVLREGCCAIHHEGTLAELAVLEAGTLGAPEGAHDDLAMAFINGLAGLWWQSHAQERGEGVSVVLRRPDVLDGLGW